MPNLKSQFTVRREKLPQMIFWTVIASIPLSFAIASQAVLKECAQANGCKIDDLDEETIRNYATSAQRKK